MADDKKSKNNFKKNVIIFALWIVGTFVLAIGISSFASNGNVSLTSPTFIALIFLGLLGYLVYVLSVAIKAKPNSDATVNISGAEEKFYDQDWLPEKELTSKSKYGYALYDQLHNLNIEGIPIRAELKKGKMHVNLYQKDYHSLVIGTTGSGKTTRYVNPTIQILGETATKPSMVISDPKGELYTLHSEKLRRRGYQILSFDLREPFNSTKWNPLDRAYMLHKSAREIRKEVRVHRGDTPTQYKDMRIPTGVSFTPGADWYEFNRTAFPTRETLEKYLKGESQKRDSKAKNIIQEVVETMCPVNGKNDPKWEEGARNLVNGVLLAMLEDSDYPELGMTREKFNFYNLSKICNLKDEGKNVIQSLSDYFKGRDPLSEAKQKANEVIANTDKTATNYMGIVSGYMGMFADLALCYGTSKNEMDLSHFAEVPTVLFIKIPDENATRYPIATLFISQLYSILCDAAEKTGNKLKRRVYFILDEFANLPAIKNFDKIITVARGRNILFNLVVQSYSQLNIVYGDSVAPVVKDNCNIHIYIASNDRQTKEDFSKRCGNKSITITSKSVSSAKGPDKKDDKSTSESKQLDQRPLIYPEELDALGDNLIVSILNEPPIKTVFTPSYLAKDVYQTPAPQDEIHLNNYFDEKAEYYDIRVRNKKVLYSDDDDEF